MAIPGFDIPAYGFSNQGQLPWKANSTYSFTDPQQIAAGYNQAYNNALGMNMGNYNNIMAGYQKAIAAQSSAQQAISAGYQSLYNDVIGKVSGIGQAREKNINDSYGQLLAGSSQQLIDRGLGNSTIQTSVNRGVETDRQRALLENDESIAKIMADYMSGLGTNTLKSQQEGLDRVSGLGLRQLDFMNSVNAKYPDAGLYGQLAQLAGAAHGAGGGAYGGGSFAGAPAPKVGYVPGGGNYYGGGGYAPPAGTGGGGGLMGGGFGGGASWNTPDPAYAYGGGGGWESGVGDPYSYNDFAGYGSNAYGGGGDF